MISNFLLVAWRNIRAQKTVSFINVFGLSIAIGICITVFLFLKNYWTLDNYHANGDHIFMVEYQTNTEGTVETWGDAPLPLATALANDFSQIVRTVRVYKEGASVLHNNDLIGDLMAYSDPALFDMFSFPLAYGNPTALNDPNAIILSDASAKKYFGDENPMGRQLTLINGNRERVTFTVQGVAQKFPANTGFKFSLLAGWHPTHTALKNMDWKSRSDGIFVQLRNPADAPTLAAQLQPYVAQFNAVNTDYTTTHFVLDNLKNPNAGAYNVIRRPAEVAHPVVAVIYSLVALLMLALSCFNYVNIALGSVVHRLREIGVRKAIGGSRWQIIVQFMTENMVLVTFSLLVGLYLAHVIFIPVQNQLMAIKTDSLFKDILSIAPFLVGLLAFVGLVSGAYPALYVSRFSTTSVFAGKQKFGEKTTLRRVLLGSQFTLAYLAVIISIVLFVSGGDFRKMPWGYDAKQALVIELSDSTQYERLKNEMAKNPQVEAISGAAQHIGLGSNKQIVTIEGKPQEVSGYHVSAEYASAMGIPLLTGRFFEPGEGDENAVVISTYFAQKQGWSDPIGKSFRLEDKDYIVVGMTADIKSLPTNAPRSIVYFKEKTLAYNYLVARFAQGEAKVVTQKTEQSFNTLFAGLPMQSFVQSEIFDNFDESYLKLSQSFSYIALLALALSCMGLYGLAAQHYIRRIKEVSIRKLHGASVGHISWLINRHFGVMLLVAGIIATALCWGASELILAQMSDYIGTYRPGIWPFVLANLLVFGMAAGTIAHQTWQTTRVRLAETLKNAD